MLSTIYTGAIQIKIKLVRELLVYIASTKFHLNLSSSLTK
jgi:hypothetical protein